MRALRRACLPVSLLLLSSALLGVVAIAFLPLPGPMVALIGGAVAMLPLLLAFCWLVRVPEIWGIPAVWVATATFLASLPLVLFGRYVAARMLTGIFREAPALFPVASTVAGYFGVLLGALALIAVVALACLVVLSGWTFLSGIAGRTGGRRFLRDAAVYVVIALVVGWTLGSVGHLERLARTLVIRVAIEADFHPDHRCDTTGWPDGVSRVAFVGDEQVLGYLPAGRRIVALSCRRAGVIGAPG